MILRIILTSFLLLGIVSFNVALSQEIINCQQAAEKVGEPVVVVGTVKSVVHKRSKTSNTPLVYINLDQNYPDNFITVIIMHRNIKKFALDATNYTNQKVLVKGVIQQTKGLKPTIFLEEREQLQLYTE